jgi:hypothetical protein
MITKAYDCMILLSKDEYDLMKNKHSKIKDVSESKVNNVEVNNGGLVMIHSESEGKLTKENKLKSTMNEESNSKLSKQNNKSQLTDKRKNSEKMSSAEKQKGIPVSRIRVTPSSVGSKNIDSTANHQKNIEAIKDKIKDEKINNGRQLLHARRRLNNDEYGSIPFSKKRRLLRQENQDGYEAKQRKIDDFDPVNSLISKRLDELKGVQSPVQSSKKSNVRPIARVINAPLFKPDNLETNSDYMMDVSQPPPVEKIIAPPNQPDDIETSMEVDTPISIQEPLSKPLSANVSKKDFIEEVVKEVEDKMNQTDEIRSQDSLIDEVIDEVVKKYTDKDPSSSFDNVSEKIIKRANEVYDEEIEETPAKYKRSDFDNNEQFIKRKMEDDVTEDSFINKNNDRETDNEVFNRKRKYDEDDGTSTFNEKKILKPVKNEKRERDEEDEEENERKRSRFRDVALKRLSDVEQEYHYGEKRRKTFQPPSYGKRKKSVRDFENPAKRFNFDSVDFNE